MAISISLTPARDQRDFLVHKELLRRANNAGSSFLPRSRRTQAIRKSNKSSTTKPPSNKVEAQRTRIQSGLSTREGTK